MGWALHTGNNQQDLNWDSELGQPLAARTGSSDNPVPISRCFTLQILSFMSMAAAQHVGVLIFNVEEGEKFFHLFRGPFLSLLQK